MPGSKWKRLCLFAALVLFGERGFAAAPPLGPLNVELLGGGPSHQHAFAQDGEHAGLSTAWTLSMWVEPRRIRPAEVLVAGFGAPDTGVRRYLALRDGRPALITEAGTLCASKAIAAGRFTYVSATASGDTVQLYVDGRRVASGTFAPGAVSATATLGPRAQIPGFGGRIAAFQLEPGAQSPAVQRRRAKLRPQPELIAFVQASPSWPVQQRQMPGQAAPQDPLTLPRSRAPLERPHQRPQPKGPALVQLDGDTYSVGGWRLREAPRVGASGETLSRAGIDTRGWYAATVPGTVLTTLIDRGVYPDPAFGLNNLAIPESLARQDYWYRTEIDLPAEVVAKRLALVFGGINYAAEIWVNGVRLGESRGAFARGRFDVTHRLVRGRNAIAVRVSPPPHPGQPHEQSLVAGCGENGGMMMLDGPTFVATEGWDWIPAMRDRHTGLWQGVELHTTGLIELTDPQVVTRLPRRDRSLAEVEITTPLVNHAAAAMRVTVRAAFDDVVVQKEVQLGPGEQSDVVLNPREFAQLAVHNPKLWWPNGYGEPALHDLQLTVAVGGQISDTKKMRFGMREVTYDLSLLDEEGELQRVTLDFAHARALKQKLVDTSHEKIRKSAKGWVMSLAAEANKSAAVQPLIDAASLAPHLVLRINGVRIAARGGNIGMDDFRKRIDRARLEPMFRLHQDAHLNIVRNWVGQSTEPAFFELADAYGMMVLSDFWESTQDVNMETDKPALFLANALDVVRRYRNHPSIVLWFGRNEGVPQPALNEALEAMVRKEDGTRLYMGASNQINLQGSGPYDWREPEQYFTSLAQGFSVEVGTPSLPTLEAWRATMAQADQWPISDAWAYHDWHQSGNGATQSFVAAMQARFGAAHTLADFERQAQMMQYESHRAIFEGFNAGLWTKHSGRMLWMTQPAWPSAAWNIFSADYDTQASFYGVKKASEPVHVQLNLPDGAVMVINNTLAALQKLKVTAHVVLPSGQVLGDYETDLAVAAQSSAVAYTLDLPRLTAQGLVLVQLRVVDATGHQLSSNLYWKAAKSADYAALMELAEAQIESSVHTSEQDGEAVLHVKISNRSDTPLVQAKLTAQHADGTRILPAYYSDNYIALLPHQSCEVTIRLPQKAPKKMQVGLRALNLKQQTINIQGL